MLEMMAITDEEFQVIRDLIYEKFGINLTDDKRSLVVGRLQKVIRDRGFSSFSDYHRFLLSEKTADALTELASKISTNHTFFFREKDHFEFFSSQALPEAMARKAANGSRDLRIWCAGCSSGEEPYTLVMLMLDHLGSEYSRWNAGVLATDISAKALTDAKYGVYAEERVELVPPSLKQNYFERTTDDQWIIADRVKREVTFRRFNLMNEHFPFKRQFDMIFCRNVMIYFDQKTRDALVGRFYDFLIPGGYLFIGHSESIPRDRSPLLYVSPALYRKGAE